MPVYVPSRTVPDREPITPPGEVLPPFVVPPEGSTPPPETVVPPPGEPVPPPTEPGPGEVPPETIAPAPRFGLPPAPLPPRTGPGGLPSRPSAPGVPAAPGPRLAGFGKATSYGHLTGGAPGFAGSSAPASAPQLDEETLRKLIAAFTQQGGGGSIGSIVK